MKRTAHPRRVAQTLLMLATAAVALPAAAQAFYSGGGSTRAEASGFGQIVTPPIDYQQRSGPQPVGTVVSSTYSATGGAGGSMGVLAQTSARPALGGVHLSAYTRVEILNGDPLSGEFGYAVAEASGQFADGFVLNVPGYAPGTLFTVTAGVRIDAINALSAAVSNNGGNSSFETTAYWSSQIMLTPSIGGYALADQRDSLSCAENQYGAGCIGDGDGWRTLSFQMPNQSWAAQLYIVGSARTRSQALLSGGGNAYVSGFADLGNTIAWGGISGLLDPSGSAVTNFSAFSAASGFDYRNAYVSAVPEPQKAWMMLAGLMGLMGAMRLKGLKGLEAPGRFRLRQRH